MFRIADLKPTASVPPVQNPWDLWSCPLTHLPPPGAWIPVPTFQTQLAQSSEAQPWSPQPTDFRPEVLVPKTLVLHGLLSWDVFKMVELPPKASVPSGIGPGAREHATLYAYIH